LVSINYLRMEPNNGKSKWPTLVIGAGQAGLATGYCLSQQNEEFVIIDRESQIGDSWRLRWDSLRLFTPAQHDGLPGFRFPAKRGSLPTKDGMADYLEQYAQQFSLPVRTGIEVTELSKKADKFEITTSAGTMHAERVVVATGTHPVAQIPAFAGELDKGIVQVHSSKYKNPQSLPPGNTLVVGAGTSGVG
jgi:putative flavoprotein involved in K+ transport